MKTPLLRLLLIACTVALLVQIQEHATITVRASLGPTGRRDQFSTTSVETNAAGTVSQSALSARGTSVGRSTHAQRRRNCQSAQAKAERIVQEELQALGWSGLDLQGRSKGDERKIKIAARLRRETTMTLRWIAERLDIGSPGHFRACSTAKK